MNYIRGGSVIGLYFPIKLFSQNWESTNTTAQGGYSVCCLQIKLLPIVNWKIVAAGDSPCLWSVLLLYSIGQPL